MADLYDRIEELQGMARVFTQDVERLRPRLGSRHSQDAVSDEEEMPRRLYVRSVFALVEALVEQHKRLLLHLANANIITLPAGAAEALSERDFVVNDNGTVDEPWACRSGRRRRS